MKCNLCNAELQKSGSFWVSDNGFITCTVLTDDGQQQNHEPAEPVAAPLRKVGEGIYTADTGFIRSASHTESMIADKLENGELSQMPDYYEDEPECVIVQEGNELRLGYPQAAPAVEPQKDYLANETSRLLRIQANARKESDDIKFGECEGVADIGANKAVRVPEVSPDTDALTLQHASLRNEHSPIQSEAGSTRPEMPPFTLEDAQRRNRNLVNAIRSDDSLLVELVEYFNNIGREAISHRLKNYALLMEKAIIHDGLIPAAESVQQEPLSAEHKLTWSEETMQIINKLTPDIKGKAFDIEWFLLRQRFEEFEYKENQAQPRTQGRELARAEEAEKIASNGLDEIRRLTEEVVRLKEAQARTQPAPRTQPACPTDDELMDLAKEFHRTQGELYETFMGLRDFYKFVHERFFTALPEATKEEK